MKIPKKLLGVVLATGVALSSAGCVDVHKGDFCVYMKKKSLFSSTYFDVCNFKEGELHTVEYISFLDKISGKLYTYIEDGGYFKEPDGIVDYLKIKINDKITNKTKILKLERWINYEEYQKEFDEADELLKKTRDEFKEYIE